MLSKILTDEQITRVHGASMTILERTGVVVPHEDMLNRFENAGASVDHEEQRVRIPGHLVMELCDKATKKFTLYGRDMSKTAEFGVGKRNYNAIAGESSWVDSIGEQRRFATMDDVKTAARVCDALSNITIAGAMSDPHEVPIEARCVEVAANMIANTTKPIYFWFHDRASAKFLIDILIALRGDISRATQFPLTAPLLEPISPLRFPFDGIDLLYEICRVNMPVMIGPMAQMGLSAPATIAGTVAQQNAEILAGICVTQLVKEGMPVCYGGICHAFDMRTTQMIFAGPEQAIFGVAMTQMGKRYGFPVYINVGLTDSKRPDAQAGLETGVTLAFGAAAGADIFGHMGICGVDQASSLDILVLQNEVIGYVNSMMRKVEISDETLGLDVIDEVGPGGSFIDTGHTVAHFRNELWFPDLLNRQYYQAWLDTGAASTEDLCRMRKEEILANHRPEPLSPELNAALDEIVANAKRKLGSSD